jgi:hypothetical protein
MSDGMRNTIMVMPLITMRDIADITSLDVALALLDDEAGLDAEHPIDWLGR